MRNTRTHAHTHVYADKSHHLVLTRVPSGNHEVIVVAACTVSESMDSGRTFDV